MSQTRFELSPDRLIMVQATIHALDHSKHVTVDLISTQVAIPKILRRQTLFIEKAFMNCWRLVVPLYPPAR